MLLYATAPLKASAAGTRSGPGRKAARMRLFVEVELAVDEIPIATELIRTLRTLTDNVRTRNVGKLFRALVARLDDPAQLESVAAEVALLLQEGGGGLPSEGPSQVVSEFFGAFSAVVFNQELVARQQSIVPYMYLLLRLPDNAKSRIRETLIPRVLKYLTLKRPVDASRMDFFAHAEAFAALVRMEFVSITGAVTTIATLLRKPETRCAAITMLGKTVELCLVQLTEIRDEGVLTELMSALQTVTEDAFQYDVNYVKDSLGWNHMPKQDAHGSSHHEGAHGDAALAASTGVLRAVDSFVGHRDQIFAMCYDEEQAQLVSGGKEGTLIVWSSEGQIVETVDMGHHYACSLDIHPTMHSLLVCGVTKEDAGAAAAAGNKSLMAPRVVCYGSTGHGWEEQGSVVKETAKLVSCIKAMGVEGEHAFVTGETIESSTPSGQGGRLQERVCYYDLNTAPNFASLQPVRQYNEHEGLITSLALYPPNPNLFFSGSRDCTVRAWDRRAASSVGLFGKMAASGRIQAHDMMITCLDALDATTIVSAGMDARVLRWDFRTLSSQGGSSPVSVLAPDDSAVLKVALGGPPSCAAVSTLRGLYIVNLAPPSPFARPAEVFSDGRRVGRYHDLIWDHSRKILYAAGDAMRVDCYRLG